jgi:hypothetical protein
VLTGVNTIDVRLCIRACLHGISLGKLSNTIVAKVKQKTRENSMVLHDENIPLKSKNRLVN